MPPKSKIPKIEETHSLEENSDSDTDQPPSAALEKKKPKVQEKAPKKPRSEAQLAAFEKAKETKRLNALARKGLADKAEEEIQNLIRQKQVKKEIKQQKMKKLQEIAEHVSSDESEEEEEEPVVIKKKVKKQTKPKIIYVDSDDEEVEKPIDKNLIIINKMHPQLSHHKPKMVKPEKPNFVFL
jgi:hypothetical protein